MIVWEDRPSRIAQVNEVAALYGYTVEKGATLFLLKPMRGARELLIPAPMIVRLSDLSLLAWRDFVESSIRDLETRISRARLVIGYSVLIDGERHRGRIDLDRFPLQDDLRGRVILSIIKERHPKGSEIRYGVSIPGREQS